MTTIELEVEVRRLLPHCFCLPTEGCRITWDVDELKPMPIRSPAISRKQRAAAELMTAVLTTHGLRSVPCPHTACRLFPTKPSCPSQRAPPNTQYARGIPLMGYSMHPVYRVLRVGS